MKIDAITIRSSEGDRDIGIDRLPLRLGTGTDCDIRMPGPGSSAVALIDELDGQPFVQPAGRSGLMQINGAPLTASRRLDVGDELEFFGTRVVVGQAGDSLLLEVRLEDSAYITKPPEASDAQAGLEGETIAPTAFRRTEEVAAAMPRTSGRRWQTAVAIAIGALVLVSYLLFSSKSIQFEVLPDGPDAVRVTGGWFRLPVGNRILMREGAYTVHVQKQGYYDVSQSFEVDATPSRTIRIEMRRLPGQLTVTTDPPVEAMVTVDDSNVGQAPYGPIELEPGTHAVTVRADRFLPYSARLAVPGLGLHQRLDVQLVPQWADVEVTSNPPGATIYEGGKVIGETPAVLELMEGTHALTVIREGFKAWDGSVDASPNRRIVIPTIEFEPADARVLVKTIPSGANVTVNGRYRGQSPVRVDLSPDVDYQIELSKAGYGKTARRVRLQAAASEEITVDLTARVGVVTVNAVPGDATVYIDGRARGTGSVELNLPSAPHRLEVKRNGYQAFSRTVTPRPGYPQEIEVRLLSDAEVEARSTATTMTNSQGQILRRVEPGDFVMGTSRSEQGRRANEVLVPVRLTRPFFIGVKEVTNREFRRFRENHDSGGGVHPSLDGDLNPVANVSWDDAVEYCNWLSAQEGLTPAYQKVFEKWQPVTPTPDGYRLPTEAEWVWAIRYQASPRAQMFPWGDRMPPRRDSGNYAGKSANALVPSILPGYDDGYAATAPSGSFAANRLGIFDGGGNVAEWVQDLYSVPTPGRTDAVVDPTGPRRGSNRVIRGSSWRHAGVMELRTGYRAFGTKPAIDVGFRIAKNVE